MEGSTEGQEEKEEEEKGAFGEEGLPGRSRLLLLPSLFNLPSFSLLSSPSSLLLALSLPSSLSPSPSAPRGRTRLAAAGCSRGGRGSESLMSCPSPPSRLDHCSSLSRLHCNTHCTAVCHSSTSPPHASLLPLLLLLEEK